MSANPHVLSHRWPPLSAITSSAFANRKKLLESISKALHFPLQKIAVVAGIAFKPTLASASTSAAVHPVVAAGIGVLGSSATDRRPCCCWFWWCCWSVLPLHACPVFDNSDAEAVPYFTGRRVPGRSVADVVPHSVMDGEKVFLIPPRPPCC